jgi:mRNA interferase RelE/StbE
VAWQLRIEPRAERALLALPEEARRRVARRIDRLQFDPRPPGCLKLAGRDGTWRLRVGDYRILYRIEDAVLVVLVIAVGHRRDVYR